ncbi:YbaK/EbsC family protein [Thalassotalea sp. M1531]|uniref:YbaK/EbsC family protein n=1 Tax=Thalassotalea algicola TaxID=2716224 RepID=A0A7Y0Q8A1_9GAMM|nr:YbaK/EbsC family protein [Thalassotalea algicola]NMP32702.1 YbaK/EbsC family protein [Thalassotalea algicola]
MSISTRLLSYLDNRKIQYQTIKHHHSNSSIGSAINANIPLHQLAKAVILQNHEDRKVMAILPASRKVSISTLNEQLMGSYRLLKEHEVYQLFEDCEHGAIPAIAEAFNMTSVCDEKLDLLDYVYIEAGDHEHLLKIPHKHFAKLVDRCMHLTFSHEVFH